MIAACSGCLQSTPLSSSQGGVQAGPTVQRNDGLEATGTRYAASPPRPTTTAAPGTDAAQGAISPANLVGEWVGNVDCGTGKTELRVQLRPKSGQPNRMEGLVNFKPLPGSRAESAAYLADGLVAQTELKLRPTEWIIEAKRFPMQALDATLVREPERLNVRILDERCKPLELTRPKFVDAVVPASASPSASPEKPSMATAPARSAPRSMSYGDLIKVIGDTRGDEKLAKPRLMGRPIQLTLKASGPDALMVNAKDRVFFFCQQRDPAFKGGLLTATITGYELTPDGDPSIELNRCSK